MSYAPIQTATTPNHRNSVEKTSFVVRNKSSRTSSIGTRRRRQGSIDLDRAHPILVHSHLCWDWVWQRPQQFLSRLSERHKILFIETIGPDPALAVPLARFRQLEEYPNITILRLQFPEWRWNDSDYVDAERRRIVQEFLTGPIAEDFVDPMQWFYDPMAVPSFLGHMGEILNVYDCMDELSKFRAAPAQLVERELELLGRADVVFTGGRRLYESKSQFHDNCHFYGCGVDIEHFGKARAAQTRIPPELASLPQPVLGYFGVIDERMDYELLAHLAEARPNWSIVMVGPTIKVDTALLPNAPNLHWLGQKPYRNCQRCAKALTCA